MNENKDFKWFNCVNCQKHLARILYPKGLIEIKFSHGRSSMFYIKIQGVADYTCPNCGKRNVISFINLPRLKPFDTNKKKSEAHEA